MREIEKEKEKQHLFIQLLGVPASGKSRTSGVRELLEKALGTS